MEYAKELEGVLTGQMGIYLYLYMYMSINSYIYIFFKISNISKYHTHTYMIHNKSHERQGKTQTLFLIEELKGHGDQMQHIS